MALTLSSSGTGGVFTLRGGSNGGRFRASVTPPATLLLDIYPGAAAAYSLRKLRTAYTGNAIRVRRSSDNTETDIGFVNNQLDTVTLLTFCGVGSGFVTTWYDQSGNARNTTQTTALNQPYIVASGTLNLSNGKPAMTFDGTDFLVNTQTLTYGDFSLFMTTKYSASGIVLVQYSKLDLAVNDAVYQSSDTGVALIASYPTADLGSVQRLQTHISTLSGATTTSKLYLNGTEKATGTRNLTSTKSTIAIGATDTGAIGANQNLQEFVLYSANQTTNRAAIETNINSFYSIY